MCFVYVKYMNKLYMDLCVLYMSNTMNTSWMNIWIYSWLQFCQQSIETGINLDQDPDMLQQYCEIASVFCHLTTYTILL